MKSHLVVVALLWLTPTLAWASPPGAHQPDPSPIWRTAADGGVDVVFTDDGAHVAIIAADGRVDVYLTASGDSIAALDVEPSENEHVSWLLTNGAVHLIGAGDELLIYDVDSGERVERRHDGDFWAPSVSPDGRHLAVVRARYERIDEGEGRTERQLEVWDLELLKQRRRWALEANGHRESSETGDYALHTVVSGDGRYVLLVENRGWSASCGGGAEWVDVQVFDRAANERLTDWRATLGDAVDQDEDLRGLWWGFSGPVATDPTHERVVVFGEDVAMFWDLTAFAERPTAGAGIEIVETDAGREGSAVFSADGERVTVGTRGRLVHFDATAPGEVVGVDTPDALADMDLRPAPGGERALAARYGQHARLWSRAADAVVGCAWPADDRSGDIDFSPDGTRAVIQREGHVELWSSTTLDDPRLAGVMGCP